MKTLEQRSELISSKDKKSKTKQEIIVNLLLDESGSMCSCLDKTLEGFNKYIKDLKTQDGNIKFTLTKFSGTESNGVKIDKTKDIKDVPLLTKKSYTPDGSTPLFDAIGKTASEIEKYISKAKTPPSVLFVIMTDGEENASIEFTKDKITELIKQKEKDGWTFVYLGANQDAFAIGGSIGFGAGNTLNYDTNMMDQTFNTLSRSTAVYARCANAVGASANYQTSSFFSDDKPKQKVKVK